MLSGRLGHDRKAVRTSSNVVAFGRSNIAPIALGWSQVADIDSAPTSPSKAGPTIGPRSVTSTSRSMDSPPLTLMTSGITSQGTKSSPRSDAATVGSHLLDEQVGVVEETGGDTPGSGSVVPGRHGRCPRHRGARHRPLRGSHVEEVPVGWQHGRQVGIVGQQRPTGGGPLCGEGPVVRPAPDAEHRGQCVEILVEALGLGSRHRRTGGDARRDWLPVATRGRSGRGRRPLRSRPGSAS